MAEYRKLTLSDLTPDLLCKFNRRQDVNLVWRKDDNGNWIIISEPFTDDWDETTKRVTAIKYLTMALEGGGFIFAAEENGYVIGFGAVEGKRIGSRSQYADLSMLHVSREFRGKGIGRRLFLLCADEAKARGAEKLYISSHSAAETQAFYRSIGCVDTVEQSKFHVELEPFDCQLEFVLI